MDTSVMRVDPHICRVHSHLDEELLVAGPPLPSKLARPGPAKAPRPPWTNANKSKYVQTVLEGHYVRREFGFSKVMDLFLRITHWKRNFPSFWSHLEISGVFGLWGDRHVHIIKKIKKLALHTQSSEARWSNELHQLVVAHVPQQVLQAPLSSERRELVATAASAAWCPWNGGVVQILVHLSTVLFIFVCLWLLMRKMPQRTTDEEEMVWSQDCVSVFPLIFPVVNIHLSAHACPAFTQISPVHLLLTCIQKKSLFDPALNFST